MKAADRAITPLLRLHYQFFASARNRSPICHAGLHRHPVTGLAPRLTMSHCVTPCHTMTHGVTQCHTVSHTMTQNVTQCDTLSYNDTICHTVSHIVLVSHNVSLPHYRKNIAVAPVISSYFSNVTMILWHILSHFNIFFDM